MSTAPSASSRQRFVQNFDVDGSLSEYRELNDRVMALGAKRLTAREAVAQAERQHDLAEAHLFTSGMVTGKNAEERKQQLVIVAQDDPGVQTALTNVQHNRAWLAEIESEIEHAERQMSAVKLRLQLIDSTLRFLAHEN